MKKLCISAVILLYSCAKQPVYAPQSQTLSQEELLHSRARAKGLNSVERQQIEQWISSQDKKFYPAALNYWMTTSPEELLPRKKDGEKISYSYEVYDFNMTKFYDKPKTTSDVTFGRFVEIRAVEDALRYLKPGTETTLLVPSVLAYGTYGDGKEISNDMPLIIRLKVLK